MNDPGDDGLPLAATLDEPLRSLAERGQPRRYRKGALIINEGEHGDTLFVLLAGRVKVFSVDTRGREITFGIYEPGATLGEMALDGGPRSASVIALEPVLCSVVTRPALLEHIGAHPEFALDLLARVISRARRATQSARNMALLDVYGRLVQLLESLAQPQPDATRLIRERITHAELASRVGCSREMVSRLIKDLEAGRFLLRDGDGWRLPARPLPLRW